MTELDAELYAHLRALAGRIHAERGSSADTLQPTALLHEAWEKLARSRGTWADRSHFVAVAARAMRQVMIDRARARGALQRNVGRRTTLSGVGDDPRSEIDVLDLDAALRDLEALDPRSAQVALLRTFGGLSVPEIAAALDLSTRTINEDWRFARAWLATRLGG